MQRGVDRSLTVVDLFAGIGGFSLGLESTGGFETICMVERDPWRQGILAKHWPNTPIIAEVEDVQAIQGAISDRPVGLISAGVPCQPVSQAGKREGKADDRWLWPETLGWVSRLLPRWFLAENPLGLAYHEGGVALDGILSELEGLGYEIAPTPIIPVGSLGSPSRRARLFIMAHRPASGSPGCGGTMGQSEDQRLEGIRTAGEFERGPPGTQVLPPGAGGSVGDSDIQRLEGQSGQRGIPKEEQAPPVQTGETVGDSEGERLRSRSGRPEQEEGREGTEARVRTPDHVLGLPSWSFQPVAGVDGSIRFVDVESQVLPVAKRIPDDVARIKAAGDAVSPQVVRQIGLAILEVERKERKDGRSKMQSE